MSSAGALSVAEELLNGVSEEHSRAAASRAYFALFQHLHSLAVHHGFAPTATGSDHKALIEFLKAQPLHSPLRRIGYRVLPRLRALRNDADYGWHEQFPKPLAEEALDLASDLIHGTAGSL